MKIILIKDIIFEEDSCFEFTLRTGCYLESDEPYQGLNEDNTFTVCQGMSMYYTIPEEYFKVIN